MLLKILKSTRFLLRRWHLCAGTFPFMVSRLFLSPCPATTSYLISFSHLIHWLLTNLSASLPGGMWVFPPSSTPFPHPTFGFFFFSPEMQSVF